MEKKTLNNRGYVLVEIVLASVLAFGVAYYILNLTIKLKDKNMDLMVRTLTATDQAIIQNKLVGYLKTGDNAFDCSKINIDYDKKIISYNGNVIDVLNDYAIFYKVDTTSYKLCEKVTDTIYIRIPIKIEAIEEPYDINLRYVVEKIEA